MTQHYTVNSIEEAWKTVNEIFPTDYEQDEQSTKNAGYPVYRSTSQTLPNAWYNYICDLGTRLEINLCAANWEGKTINIHIEEPAPEVKEESEKSRVYFDLCDKFTGEIYMSLKVDNFSFDGKTFEFYEDGKKIGDCVADTTKFWYSITYI